MATMIGTSNTNADRVRLNLNRLDTDLSKVTQRLSLGLQLPLDRPGDTGVASQLESQIRGLHSAGINIQNGVGILSERSQTVEADAKHTAEEIAKVLKTFFVQQGWISPSCHSESSTVMSSGPEMKTSFR